MCVAVMYVSSTTRDTTATARGVLCQSNGHLFHADQNAYTADTVRFVQQQLSAGWSSSHTAAKVAVSPERRSSVGVLIEEVRARNPSPPSTTLVASSGANSVSVMYSESLTYRCLNGTAPQYLAETLQKSTNVEVRRRLRSAATSTLIVPSTRRSTLGDRAFPVVAARVWNALLRRSVQRLHCVVSPGCQDNSV